MNNIFLLSVILFFVMLFLISSLICLISYRKVNRGIIPNRNIFYYWDDIDGTPEYINLCHEILHKNARSFNVIRLNKDNIFLYLPELKNVNMDHISIAQKVDIYRVYLLYKYGGIYFDSDIILLKDPTYIFDKLKEYDFIGFKAGVEVKGYVIGNWALASRKNSPLMRDVLKEQLKIIKQEKIDYHDLGKVCVWNTIKKGHYDYFLMDNEYLGNKDIHGKFITSMDHFTTKKIELNEDKLILFVFYNSELTNQIKSMTKKDLLSSNINISKFFRRGIYGRQ